MKEKDVLKIVIGGHIDHGKSTLIGRLLIDTKSLPKEKLKEIKTIAKQFGKEVEIAYIADQLKEERERNITIDTTQVFFKTKKRNYVLIDAPGHVEFIKNMLSGTTNAQAAILIIDAKEGIQEQTYRHAYLFSLLGLKNILVVINKMDLVDYNQAHYDQIVAKLRLFLNKLALNILEIAPISAREGVNISKRSTLTKWYEGATFLESLDRLSQTIQAKKQPLRIPIQDCYCIDEQNINVGAVASGCIKKNQDVIVLPDLISLVVKEIKVFKKTPNSASEGCNIGLVFKNNKRLKRGAMVVSKEEQIAPKKQIIGNIFWLDSAPLKKGQRVMIKCATQEVECVVERIDQQISPVSLDVLSKDASQINENEAGVVIFKPNAAIVTEAFSSIPELGRFVISDQQQVLGVGVIS